jgi:hypothetical protein
MAKSAIVPLAGAWLLAALLALPSVAARAAQDQADPDWPCIQIEVPSLTAGMVWAGPSVDGLERAWKDNEEVAHLVARLTARRTSIDEAKALVADFAEGLETDRNHTLSLLFAGTLAEINHERGEVIAGIKRYSRRQKALAAKIEERTAEIDALAAQEGDEARKQRRKLEEEQVWDTRVFDEREHSLTYVCEVPVLLEQRLFQIAREIMAHLE